MIITLRNELAKAVVHQCSEFQAGMPKSGVYRLWDQKMSVLHKIASVDSGWSAARVTP